MHGGEKKGGADMENKTKKTGRGTARFCIQTIRYQDVIAYHFRVYVFYAAGIMTMLFLAGKIEAWTALSAMAVGSLSICILMGLLIHARKKALLGIEDPDLRQEAHEIMLAWLSRKKLSKKERRIIFNHRKTCHCELCR